MQGYKESDISEMSDKEKCPYCGNIMKKGFLDGTGYVFLSLKEVKFARKRLAKEDWIVLCDFNEEAQTYLCQNCKTVICDYGNCNYYY